MMVLDIPEKMVRRIIEALEDAAQMEAGQSMEPLLIFKEDTSQWKDAQRLRGMLADGGA